MLFERDFKVTTTIDTEEIGTSSSTVGEIRISEEQESQTIDWDEILLERYLRGHKRAEHILTLLKNINRLEKVQAGWWEFTSFPDLIVELGATKYFIELKFGEKSRRVASVLSEIATRDVFQRNLITFFRTKLEEESSIISALKERLAEEIIPQSGFQDTFAEFLSSQSKRLLAEQHPTSRGSPQAVLQAMDASPHPTDEDINDLFRIISDHEQSSNFASPLDEQ